MFNVLEMTDFSFSFHVFCQSTTLNKRIYCVYFPPCECLNYSKLTFLQNCNIKADIPKSRELNQKWQNGLESASLINNQHMH